jgi:hypothetical protein
MTARVVHLSIQSGAALIPLAFLCVERAVQATDDRRATKEDKRSLVVGRNRWFVAAAGAVALQALAGHPQIPVYTALALGLYVLVRAAERRRGAGGWRWLYRLPLLLAGVYLLGYGLAAIQLVPWIELGTFSPRAAGASFDLVFNNSTNGGDWLLMLFPYLYGSLRPTIYADAPMGLGALVRTWEHTAYVGILPLALAAYALLGLREITKDQGPKTKDEQQKNRMASRDVGPSSLVVGPRRWTTTLYFGLLLLGAALFAAGKYGPLANLIYATPLIGKLRDVERAMALGDFALAALAAIGWQRLMPRALAPLEHPDPPSPAPPRGTGRDKGVWRPSLLAIAAATVLLPALVVLLARRPWFQEAMMLPPQAAENLQLARLNAAVPLALALLSAALLLWWSRRPATPTTQALATGLVLLDMVSFAAPFNPLAEPRLYERRPDVLAAFESQGAPFRKATFLLNNDLGNRAAQETLAVSWGMPYGVEDVNGFNSLQPRRYTDYLFGPQFGDVSYGYLMNEHLLQPESPILSALNVRYVLVPAGANPPLGAHLRQVYQNAEVRVYENTLAYPRAYFVGGVRAERDPQAILRAVTADGFDGRALALVEADEPPALAPATGPAEATVAEIGANRLVVTTISAEARLLVLSEMYFPGWRAAVDGAETPIYRTNYLFRGVVVPAGRHTVTFEYRPTSVALGAAISAAALLAAALLFRARRARN